MPTGNGGIRLCLSRVAAAARLEQIERPGMRLLNGSSEALLPPFLQIFIAGEN